MRMNAMKKILALMLLTPVLAWASEGSYPLDEMIPNLDDKASLQGGAATYMNYCMGCHSLKYQRYVMTAKDLGISEEMMLEHLAFDSDTRIGDLMENSMNPDDARNWFGIMPPDLTMLTKLKGGPSWLYTYMRTFYIDESRPFGVNNLVFENVGMPHVLVQLQGRQEKICKQIPVLAKNGGERRDPLGGQPLTEEKCGQDLVDREYSPLQLIEGSGKLTSAQYDKLIYDLANFLYYTGDPTRQERERIGVYVLLFLAFFAVFSWLLHREYWKNIH